MLSLDYIAGLLDADGSFSISVMRRKDHNGNEIPQFSFVVNFRQLERARDILEEIQEVLGGHIYNHTANPKPSRPSRLMMLTWQTTKAEDARKVCQTILPYLHIKQDECALLLEALNLWIDTPRLKGKGSGIIGKPSAPDWVKQRVMEISTQMNSTQQKETSRRNKEIRAA